MSTRKSLLVVKGARVFSSDFCNSRGGCYVFVSKEGKREISRSCGVTNLKQTSALREWWYQRCLLVCLQKQLWNKEGDRWSRADETRERQQTKVGGRPILTILTSTILNWTISYLQPSASKVSLSWSDCSCCYVQYASHAWFITFQLRICKTLFLNSRVQLFQKIDWRSFCWLGYQVLGGR